MTTSLRPAQLLEVVAADGSQSRGPADAGEPTAEAGQHDPDHSAEATGRRLSLAHGPGGPGGIRALSSCLFGSLWPQSVMLASSQEYLTLLVSRIGFLCTHA